MNKKTKKTIFILLPILLGVFLIWYSITKLTPQNKTAIKHSFETANYFWVFLSLCFGALSHFSRAYRWYFLLEPLGYKPRYINSVLSVFVAYFLNLFVPRSGEVARASMMTKYEDIPFEKGFGTIVAERLSDIVMLLIIIGIAFFYQADLITDKLFPKGSNPFLKIIYLSVFLSLLYIIYRVAKNTQNKIVLKIKNFIIGLKDGVLSVLSMQKKWAFIFHTFFIWTMYVLMFYTVTFAIPETTNLPFEAVIVGFVIGALSMALTNGGLGYYPTFVAGVLTLYAISKSSAFAFGWIMWTAQTAMVVLFGALSLFLLPLVNKEK